MQKGDIVKASELALQVGCKEPESQLVVIDRWYEDWFLHWKTEMVSVQSLVTGEKFSTEAHHFEVIKKAQN